MNFRLVTVLLAILSLNPLIQISVQGEVGAHSHNDYEQTRPLLAALESGFGSIEADVYLVNGRLLVGHTVASLKPERTLESLYLDPLRTWFKTRSDSKPLQKPLQLMVDVKTEANTTWIALHSVLTNYSDILTRFETTNTINRALMVVISGNRSIELMQQQNPRFAGYDGRLEDLITHSTWPPSFMPMVSGAWSSFFKWRGNGDFSETDRKHLRESVLTAHKQGRTLRFWGAPDGPNTWQVLASAGVDWINTDRIVPVADFLRNKPRPDQPAKTP